MDQSLEEINTRIYSKLDLSISGFLQEPESQEYAACRFELSGRRIICRKAKITPKKVGQFVTFWKRIDDGPIEPFNEIDEFDFFVVNIRTETRFGQFVFPKSELIKRGIISTEKKEGKRAFRVYPKWDTTESSQAKRTQKWQSSFFYEISGSIELKRVSELYDVA